MDDELFKAAAEKAMAGDDKNNFVKIHAFVTAQLPSRSNARDQFVAETSHVDRKSFRVTLNGDLKQQTNKLSKYISSFQKGDGKNCLALILKWLWTRNSSRADVLKLFEHIGFDPETALEDSKVQRSPLAELKRLDPNRALVQPNPQVEPYDFETLIVSATSSITFIEQNQWYLVGENGRGKDYWPRPRPRCCKAGISGGRGYRHPRHDRSCDQ